MIRAIFILSMLVCLSLNGQQTGELIPKSANGYFQSMNQEQSLSSISFQIANNPESVKLLLESTQLKRMYGLDKEAARDLEKAVQINPYAVQLFGFYGPSSILDVIAFDPLKGIQELDLEKRLSFYYESLDNTNVYIDSVKAILLYEALNLVEKQDLTNALSLLDKIQQDYPSCAMAFDLEGLIWEKKEDFDKAKVSLTKATDLQPGYSLAWYNLSRVERLQGNLGKARDYLDKVIGLQSDLTKAYFDRALLLKLMGEEAKAIQDYNKILEITEEENVEVYLNRGLTQKMVGNFEQAIVDLNRAIEEYPDNAILYKNRGNLKLMFGYYEGAIADFTHAIKLKEDFAAAYLNRGLTYYLNSLPNRACEDLHKSSSLDLSKASELIPYFCN